MMTLGKRTILFGSATVCLFLLTADTVRSVVDFSISNTMVGSQILAAPLISMALILRKRAEIFQASEGSPIPGVVAIAVGLMVVFLPGSMIHTLSDTRALTITAMGVLATWLGCFVLFYGTDAFRSALFPLALLAFSVPMPSALAEWAISLLQRASAETAYVLLKLTGTPVYRERFVFELPGLMIEIAPECSGIRSGIAMLMTSLIGGYLMLETWWRRSLLIVAALPLLIIKNAIRIDTLSLLSIHIDPSIIEGRLHHEGGVVFFVMGLLLLYPILILLMKAEQRQGTLRLTGAQPIG